MFKYVMIGGANAFIAQYHLKAMGGVLVGGAFHKDPLESKKFGEACDPPVNGYATWQDLVAAIKSGELEADVCIIVTPNHLHAEPAIAMMKAGVAVVCEKPLTKTLEEAEEFARVAEETGVPVLVTYTYAGHWSLRLARHIVTSGVIGDVRKAGGWYFQGWLFKLLESMPDADGHQQALWRTNPDQAGISCCGGDIGTHIKEYLEYVTGMKIKSIEYARLTINVTGRKIDDDFLVIATFENGAMVTIQASQIMVGHKNDVGLEITGTHGSVIWHQEHPEELILHLDGHDQMTLFRGAVANPHPIIGELPEWLINDLTGPDLPGGHPQGYNDAEERIYAAFELDVTDWKAGKVPSRAGQEYPSFAQGLSGIEFVYAAVECNKTGKPQELPA